MARRTYRLAVDIARRLNQAREESGITVRQLARIAQVNPSTVMAISKGESRNPGVATIADLAKALGVNPSWLAYGE